MIWNDSISAAITSVEMLTTHIIAEIRSADPDFPDSAALPEGEELARSVAEFVSWHSQGFRRRPPVADYGGQVAGGPPFSEASPKASFAGASSGVLVPSDYLLIMVCRALWAVGKEETARALLRSRGPEFGLAESYAEAVFADDLFPCLGLHSSIVRALRPSSSLWSLNGPYWILNLRTVFSFLNAGLELTVWRILHALLKQLAALWDVAHGKGALGLKQARFVSTNMLGFPRKSKQGRQFTAEALRYCEEDLKMAAEERKWRFTPAVINLDP